MPPFPTVLERATIKSVEVSISQANNVFSSLILLTKDPEGMPGVHDWVLKIHSKLKKKELENLQLALTGFFFALLPNESDTTFPAYLVRLNNTDPDKFKNELLSAYAAIGPDSQATQPVDWSEVLASRESYISFLESRFGKQHIDTKVESRAYELVTDPPAMKAFLVDQMNWLWETYAAQEWQRVQPMLQESVRSFRSVDLTSMSRTEAARFVTGQDLDESKWCEKLDNAERLVFVPNAHIGPFINATKAGNVLYVVFGARQPDQIIERIPELDRNEIVAQLTALSDDTRLHILQLAIEQGEVRVQDIMEATNLSQPSVSRYLSQLTSTGYLQERRESSSKVYVLNRDRIEKTLKAVGGFLLGR